MTIVNLLASQQKLVDMLTICNIYKLQPKNINTLRIKGFVDMLTICNIYKLQPKNINTLRIKGCKITTSRLLVKVNFFKFSIYLKLSLFFFFSLLKMLI